MQDPESQQFAYDFEYNFPPTHTPTRASQGDVGTRSNASTSTACQTRTAQAAASGRNDILFQPCITRRQGSETNVARTPGVSQQAPPERKPMPIADMPYIGDFRGCTWNAQALFARRASRQCPKQRQVRKLLQNHDFLAVQETHSTEGGVLAFECPAGTAARWSHGTTQRAGIGLLLQDSFLSNFNVLQEGDWEEIEAGRAAVLHLRGPQGSHDIWVLYMATGEDGPLKSSLPRPAPPFQTASAEAPCASFGPHTRCGPKRSKSPSFEANRYSTPLAGAWWFNGGGCFACLNVFPSDGVGARVGYHDSCPLCA